MNNEISLSTLLLSTNEEINDIFVYLFRIRSKDPSIKEMQIVHGPPYIYDMRFHRTHTCARTHTHFARVYIRSGNSSVRPLCASVYESSCIYVYAQIGVLRRHGRLCYAGCVPRCVYIHVCMCARWSVVCACHSSAGSPSALSRGGRVLNFHPLFNRRLRSRLH